MRFRYDPGRFRKGNFPTGPPASSTQVGGLAKAIKSAESESAAQKIHCVISCENASRHYRDYIPGALNALHRGSAMRSLCWNAGTVLGKRLVQYRTLSARCDSL